MDMTTKQGIPHGEINGPAGWVVKWFSRKQLGEVPEAMGVMWQNRSVLFASIRFGRKIEKWNQVDPQLKTFAHMAVASRVGCSWCLDYNYFKAHNDGLDEAKASQVPRWRESTTFTALERDVLEYAEAMSETPPCVSDELSARLLKKLGAPALLELTAVVAFANFTTRSNTALGIESQEFSQVCDLPLAEPSARTAMPA
jgi:alkylhydroperoxidase family enzyme